MEPIIIMTNRKPVTTIREKLSCDTSTRAARSLPCNWGIIYGHMQFSLKIIIRLLVNFRFRRLFSEDPGTLAKEHWESFS